MKAIVCAPIVGATVLGKFALPPWGADGFGITFPIIFAALLYGLMTRRLQFAWRRLTLFFVMLSVLGMTQVLRGEVFSFSSVALLSALGFCYVVTGRGHAFDSERMLEFFGNLTFLLAVGGILQFLLLLAGGTALAFPIDKYLPTDFQTAGYNSIAPLFYGSNTYKSTGFVMLEPSFFSQLTALGLLAEIVGKMRLLRLAAYAGAMILSYSGTGMLILAVTLPMYVVMYRRWNLLIPAVCILTVIVLLAEPLQLSRLLGRTSEFSRVGSSGFARFVGWRELFEDKLWNSPVHALFGHGAGSWLTGAAGYSAAQMSYSKIIFEFGVIGAILYFGFIFYCMFSSRAPLLLRVGMAVCYLLNGAYAPTVAGIFMSLLLWPGGQEKSVDETRAPVEFKASRAPA